MSKKKLLSLSLVVIMVAILSFGTLAWFNDADSVTNEFYVADSDGDGMPDFTIDVKEQKVDENGNPVVDDEGNPVYDEDDRFCGLAVEVPEGVKLLSSAFANNAYLFSVTVPDGVESISDYAFYGSAFLESVTVGEGVEKIRGLIESCVG